jgi:thiol-disulfide isomerase/thioredoxin
MTQGASARWPRLLAMMAMLFLAVGMTPGQGDDSLTFLFFYAYDCPHCEAAKPSVRELADDNPDVAFRWYEVKRSEKGRRKFIEKVRELGIDKPSVPTFVCGGRYLVGFTEGKTDKKLHRLVADCRSDASS